MPEELAELEEEELVGRGRRFGETAEPERQQDWGRQEARPLVRVEAQEALVSAALGLMVREREQGREQQVR